jgi:hypothetical protein
VDEQVERRLDIRVQFGLGLLSQGGVADDVRRSDRDGRRRGWRGVSGAQPRRDRLCVVQQIDLAVQYACILLLRARARVSGRTVVELALEMRSHSRLPRQHQCADTDVADCALQAEQPRWAEYIGAIDWLPFPGTSDRRRRI